jgi:hypothetical protein
MNRRIRATAALFAIVAMLFAPLAMALHACASAGDMVAAAEAVAMAAQAAADDSGGAPMDMALCEQHCNDGSKVSFDLAKPPASMAVPVVPALRVDALEPVSLRAPAPDSPFAPATGPAPPLIRYTVLRI